MKTKRASTFRKGDQVRWRTDSKRRTDRKRRADNGRLRSYSGEVGEVTSIQPNPSPHPPTVWVRSKKGGHTGFCPDWLEHA